MFENRAISIEKMVSQILRTGSLRDGNGITPQMREKFRGDFELIRPENYQFSKPINYKYSKNGIILNLFDTIDAINTTTGEIELLSYTTTPLEFFDPNLEIITLARATIIAFAYMVKNNLNSIHITIFWFRFGAEQQSELKETLYKNKIQNQVEEYILTFLEWAKPFKSWKAVRNNSIKDIQFPFMPYRAGQREMMAYIYKATKESSNVLIEAPTGIGKTMASIFPAIKSLSDNTIDRIFYATARNTGQDAVVNAVNILVDKGARLKTVVIRSKDRACARKDAIRECDDCQYSNGYYDRLIDGLHVAFKNDIISNDIVDKIGNEYLLCPFELSLDLSLHCDIIVVDYNYIFDPNVALKRFFAEVEENYLFLIDETHNLVERARASYSATITKNMINEIKRITLNRFIDLDTTLSEIVDNLTSIEKSIENNDNYIIEEKPPYHIVKQCRAVITEVDEILAQKKKYKFKKQLLEFYFNIRHFVAISEQFSEEYTTIYSIKDNDFSVTLFNINPAYYIKKRLAWSKSSALFSATISPHFYFKKVLGLEEDAITISLPSPFPKENLLFMVADPVSTKLNKRDTTIHEVIGAIEAVVKSKDGNYMAFFPSYDYMNKAVSIFRRNNTECNILVQKQNMSQEEREEFLQHFSSFRAKDGGTLVGFAVMGGIFSEGVDFVGDMLNGVVIVGVGLPGLSPEREEIRRYFNENRDGFDYSYTFPGINKVLQAVGRVIRTKEDKGVALLIDDRFGTEKYLRLLPSHYSPYFVKSRDDVENLIQNFYQK